MSDAQIKRDIERKVLDAIGSTMRRELEIAKLVLDNAEMALLLLFIAKGATATAAATVAGMLTEDMRGEIFDQTVDQVASMTKEAKPDLLVEIATKYAEVRR